MQAESLANFLLPMLQYDPTTRASAQEMLQDPWLGNDQPPQGSRKDVENAQAPCTGSTGLDCQPSPADRHQPQRCSEPNSEDTSRIEDFERSERLSKKARYPH